MDKIEILNLLKQERIISVVRTDSSDTVELVKAIAKGGIRFIEITLTMDKALETISTLSRDLNGDNQPIIGAGTVLDVTSCMMAIQSGAHFIVSPSFNQEVSEMCNLYRIPYIPGVYNPSDIERALRSGVDMLKLFPASTYDPFIIKEFKGPFPQADFIISGKVNQDNALSWLNSGASAVCIGSLVTSEEKNGLLSVENISKELKEYVGTKV